MKALALLVLASSYFVTAGAQPNPDTLWTRTYGGSEYDGAFSIQQTADGGYVVAGRTESFGAGGGDFYVVKTNAQGDTLWTRTYGGNSVDWPNSIQQTTDGGYIVAGYTESFGAGSSDFYVAKTDAQGDTLWTRTYGGSGWDEAYSIQQTADGGYVMAGYADPFSIGDYDFYVVKTDAQGDTLWTRTYGGSLGDRALAVQQTSDGGYIMAGYTYSFGAGYYDFHLVKTDSEGDTLWTRTYGGSNENCAWSIQQTTDGGFIVAGATNSFGAGDWDYYLVKTDSQGDSLWARTYGGSSEDYAFDVQQTNDGGYAVAGFTNSFGAGTYDIYLVRTDSQGDTLWTRTYGGSDWDVARSIQQTTDGGYVIAGVTQSFGVGDFDFYVVKTGPEPQGSEPVSESIPEQYALYPNFPNPFNATTQINYELPKAARVSLCVFNLLGEEVVSLVDGVQAAGKHAVAFDGSGLASGVYLYRLQAEGFVQAKKMVLIK